MSWKPVAGDPLNEIKEHLDETFHTHPLHFLSLLCAVSELTRIIYQPGTEKRCIELIDSLHDLSQKLLQEQHPERYHSVLQQLLKHASKH